MLVLRWLISVLVLPGTVIGLIPLGLFHLSKTTGVSFQPAGFDSPWFWLALPPGLFGAFVGVWTMVLFFVSGGDGTPAPWDPPKRLVVRGPYRHVRNPMIVGVVLVLLGMGLYFRSPLVVGWSVVFFLGNTVYFRLSEEPGLHKRFGGDYARYFKNVPRWIPRTKPWDPE